MIVLFVSASCSTDEPQPELTSCISVLLGDKDGFGLGLKEGDPFFERMGVMLPWDYREPSDPRQTDIYPADMGTSSVPTQLVKFDFEFDLIPNGISSATLTLFTLGIQDGGTNVVGCDYDYVLYLDGKEVQGAFDDIDQFGFINGRWAGLASTIEFELKEEFFSVLRDGKVSVRIEIKQLGPGESMDAFLLDFAELTLCPSNQPAV